MSQGHPDAHPFRRGRLDDRDGPAELLFGRMVEDAAIERAAIPPGSRVFCIASAGCVALALAARGDRVTAADVNPAQVDYVKARLAGAPPREGTIDRMFALGRRRLRFAGLEDVALREFLSLSDARAQTEALAAHPDWIAAFSSLLTPLATRGAYDDTFRRALPPAFERVFAARLLRTIGRHPNRENPFLWRLLAGEPAPGCDDPAPTTATTTTNLPVVHADAATFLEAGPPASFDAFALSNIGDGSGEPDRQRLDRALRHAAAPGAIVIARTLGEPANARDSEWAARDRSPLWGAIRVEQIA